METVKIARETMEGLFNLHVGLAEDIVNALCAGIAECISGCAALSANYESMLTSWHALGLAEL